MRPKQRPMHSWQPTVWGVAKPFYDWAYRKESPMIPLPRDWALENISQPSATRLAVFRLNLNLGDVSFLRIATIQTRIASR